MRFSIFLRQDLEKILSYSGEPNNECRCRKSVYNESRGILLAILLFKAIFVIAWLFRANLLFKYECGSYNKNDDVRTKAEIHTNDKRLLDKEMIVLKQNNNNFNKLWYSANEFTPSQQQQQTQQYIRADNIGSEISNNFQSNSNSNQEFGQIRQKIKESTSYENNSNNNNRQSLFNKEWQKSEEIENGKLITKWRRIIKIVRKPLNSMDRETLSKRFWRYVNANDSITTELNIPTIRRKHVKTILQPISSENSNNGHSNDKIKSVISKEKDDDVDAAPVKNIFNNLRRIKVIKRIRKIKKESHNYKDKISTASSLIEIEDIDDDAPEKSRPDKRYSGQYLNENEKGNETTKKSTFDDKINTSKEKDFLFVEKSDRSEENTKPTNGDFTDKHLLITTIALPPMFLEKEKHMQDFNSAPLITSVFHNFLTTSHRRLSHFMAQFDKFKNSALCLAQTLLDAWCGVQSIALMLLIVGVSCLFDGHIRIKKMLIMPHLILDALLLLVLLIVTLTTAVFGGVLFILVDEMTLTELIVWFAFSGGLLVVLIGYAFSFGITMGCIETLLREHLLSLLK